MPKIRRVGKKPGRAVARVPGRPLRPAPKRKAARQRLRGETGELARKQGATDGFRTIINTGRIGHQEVYHLHVHILGGPEPLGSMLKRRAPGP